MSTTYIYVFKWFKVSKKTRKTSEVCKKPVLQNKTGGCSKISPETPAVFNNETKASETTPFTANYSPVQYTQALPQPLTIAPKVNEPPKNTQNNVEQGFMELVNTLTDQVNLSRLPPPEPGIFSGDPLKFPGWKSDFQTLIETRRIPASERIHYLKKYLGGSAKEAVECYFLMTSDDAYDNAKKLLDERFGDPVVIGNAFRDRLRISR